MKKQKKSSTLELWDIGDKTYVLQNLEVYLAKSWFCFITAQ